MIKQKLNSKIFKKALEIATRELKSNYGEFGIYASPFKHKQYWARDSFISSFGASSLEDAVQVRKNLDTFIKYQRKDGHIPARIEENYHPLTVFGIFIKRQKLKALHKQSQPWSSDVTDSNSWFLIAAHNYIKVSSDLDWLNKNINNLNKAAQWLVKNMDKNFLETEGFTANWSDCNFVSGNTLYNNILTWKSLVCVAELNKGDLRIKFNNLSDLVKKEVNKVMWDDINGYFIHYLSPNHIKHDEFYTDGNLLAIWFDFATADQTARIYQFMDGKLGVYKTPIAYPRLVWWDHILNHILFPMYKTENTFTLWSCIYSISKFKSNNPNQGFDALTKMAETIVKYGTCHEVLKPNGEPVDLWFYKSEKSMSWTAGMFIYAYSVAISVLD